jgi:caffeic acid 3-O-methyltransferase
LDFRTAFYNPEGKAKARGNSGGSASSSSAEPQESMATKSPRQLKQIEEDEVFSQAMELACGSVLPMAMNAAIELGVFDILANAGPGATLSAEQIAAQMPAKNPDAPAMLERICDLLVYHCVLGCSVVKNAGGDGCPVRRLYFLLPVSKYFARNQDGVSLAPLMTLNHDKVYLDSWLVLLFYYSFISFIFFNHTVHFSFSF